MALTMFVAAAMQGLTGIAIFIAGTASSEPPGPVGLLMLIEAFAAIWLGSALLFRKAARS
jgi:hypothetical protein